MMEAIEPREDEIEDMNYEVNYDLLIGYCNNLLASLVDKKQKRLNIVEEKIIKAETSSAPLISGKGKKKKVEQVPLVSTSTRVT